MMQHEMRQVTTTGVGGDPLHRTEDWPEHRKDVRAKIPYRAFLAAPRRVERARLRVHRCEPGHTPARPARFTNVLGKPDAGDKQEREREQHNGCELSQGKG